MRGARYFLHSGSRQVYVHRAATQGSFSPLASNITCAAPIVYRKPEADWVGPFLASRPMSLGLSPSRIRDLALILNLGLCPL